jgi:hypothetical protein
MTRSKLSIKATLLVSGIGLAAATIGRITTRCCAVLFGRVPLSGGYGYDPSYDCTLSGDAYEPYGYGYLPYSAYGRYYGGHDEFGHGFAHGIGGGAAHDFVGGSGHSIGGSLAHGMGGGHR